MIHPTPVFQVPAKCVRYKRNKELKRSTGILEKVCIHPTRTPTRPLKPEHPKNGSQASATATRHRLTLPQRGAGGSSTIQRTSQRPLPPRPPHPPHPRRLACHLHRQTPTHSHHSPHRSKSQ